ncbi:MAG: glycosyltransferase family 25 protein [Bauldia sp.]
MAEAGRTTAGAGAFDDTFTCHVINLARTPQRWFSFCAQNEGCGIDFRRFEAVDGSKIGFDEAIRRKIIKPGSQWDSKGRIGVAMSHLELWQRTVAGGRPLIVLEDDAFVRDDIKTAFTAALARLADPWEFILFGYNTDSLVEFNLVGDIDLGGTFSVRYPTPDQLAQFVRSTDPVNLLRLRHAFGPCGYAVSPEGARKLTAACFPMDNRIIGFSTVRRRMAAFSFDSMLNAAYPSIAAFVCIPPLVLTANDKATSTISSR